MKPHQRVVQPVGDVVAPRAGAWIETRRDAIRYIREGVAPRAGAWIETSALEREEQENRGRPPCGGVD